MDVAPMAAVIVPPSCPTHAGWVGMPPGPTEIVYGSVDPVRVPVRNPFSSTMPFGNLTRIGPLTAVPVCVNVHAISDDVPCKEKLPFQVPVRSITEGEGTVVDRLDVQLLSSAALTSTTVSCRIPITFMSPANAESVPTSRYHLCRLQ